MNSIVSSSRTCPSCGSTALRDVVSLGNQPVICNQLWPTADAARAAPTIGIDLAYCPDCTLLTNRSFRPEAIAYSTGYENALHFSPRFRDFAEELGKDLIMRHGLEGGQAVEIGCGDGYFLDLLVRNGMARGIGFDPSMENRPSEFTRPPEVEILPELFRKGQLDGEYDIVICRHVLEHMTTPQTFLKDVRDALEDRDCVLYFEVPNGEWILKDCSIWDLIYEHVTYWTAPALETAFRRAGFRPLSIRSAYGGQFLSVEAVPDTADPAFLPELAVREEMDMLQDDMRRRAGEKLDFWTDRIAELTRDGRQAALWGAGSKGITFANTLQGSGECLAALIDLNTRKHGQYVPGAALPVVSPENLRDLPISDVLVSNALYIDEIRQQLSDLGVKGTVQAI